jgi:hypothetical protein
MVLMNWNTEKPSLPFGAVVIGFTVLQAQDFFSQKIYLIQLKDLMKIIHLLKNGPLPAE